MKSIVLFFIFALLAIGANAQDQTGRRIKQFNLSNGVAAGGYDPVSYFNDGGPLKGSKENAVVYEGITYYFSSPVNKAAFK
jgi:YHS domain-containing protein